MDTSCKDKILKSGSITETMKILETVGASPSAKELMRLSISIQETQPQFAKQYRETIVKEIEDAEEEKKKQGVTEADGGVDHSSTSTTGLSKEGTEVKKEDVRSEPGTKDQMTTSVSETYPGGQPQQVPPMQQGGGMPPQPPGMMPPPQQQPPQAMQQMQYTLQEIQGAMKLIDGRLNKIEETQRTSNQPTSINVGKMIKAGHAEVAVRETAPQVTNKLAGVNEDYINTKQSRLHQDSNDLTRINTYLENRPRTGVE